MAKFKIVNGESVQLTSEEEKEVDEKVKAWADGGELNYNLNQLRNIRNILLKETDYLGLSDLTMSSSFKTYRQSLRDITKDLNTVEKVQEKMKQDIKGKYVNFPDKPTE
tara:strand:+ start:647 stop:973 length:327 start_codon:yes stop_codon:yes gene_type:complete